MHRFLSQIKELEARVAAACAESAAAAVPNQDAQAGVAESLTARAEKAEAEARERQEKIEAYQDKMKVLKEAFTKQREAQASAEAERDQALADLEASKAQASAADASVGDTVAQQEAKIAELEKRLEASNKDAVMFEQQVADLRENKVSQYDARIYKYSCRAGRGATGSSWASIEKPALPNFWPRAGDGWRESSAAQERTTTPLRRPRQQGGARFWWPACGCLLMSVMDRRPRRCLRQSVASLLRLRSPSGSLGFPPCADRWRETLPTMRGLGGGRAIYLIYMAAGFCFSLVVASSLPPPMMVGLGTEAAALHCCSDRLRPGP